jgi:DNA-binding MarR family transcriptional regulator
MALKKPLAEARRYLEEVLGVTAANDRWGEPWGAAKQLPFFLQDGYAFYQADIFEKPCLLMLSRNQEGETPAVVRKHWQAVSKQFPGDVIYLVEAITSFNRKRLIEQRVPFLVPGNQLYLPMLGVDLRERFRQTVTDEKATFSPAAQALVLRQILQNDCSEKPAKELANRLGYTSMTVGRVMAELEDKDLIEVVKVGREKRLRFTLSGKALWEAALPVLQSPVKNRVWIVARDQEKWVRTTRARLAGEAAMAHYTMLAGPEAGIWAVNANQWSELSAQPSIKVLKKADLPGRDYHRQRDVLELELWTYNPATTSPKKAAANTIGGGFSADGLLVDPLSLWLSMETKDDERLEMARESLLDQVWSQLPW